MKRLYRTEWLAVCIVTYWLRPVGLAFAPLILVMPWSAALAQSDGAVHGVVVASADGTSVPNATVRLESAPGPDVSEATTETDGHFGFQRLAAGDYVLTVTHGSFREERYRVTLKPREVLNLTLRLSLRGIEQAVDVTADPGTLYTTHSPSSTFVSSADIGQLPLAQRSNLTDVIVTAAPGMIRGHDDFVHIRGSEIALNPSINGISFWENAHSVFSSGLGADYIGSINVMTGGFPAEYGNRFGGVLDVSTKSGYSMNNNGAITLGAGTALRHNASIEFGGHTERAGYYLNVSGFESARFLSPPDPRSIHNTGRGARSFLQTDFRINSRDFVKLILMSDGTNFQIPKTSLDDVLRPNLNSFQRTRSQNVIVSWDRTFSNKALLQTSFYQKWSKSRLLPNDDPYGAKADGKRTVATYGIKSDMTRYAGRHVVKTGIDLVMLRPDEQLSYLSQPWIDYTHVIGSDHIHFRGPNRGPVVFDQKRTGGQVSAYIQDNVQLTRALTADIGLRFDNYNLAVSNFHFSPRINLAYRLPRGTLVHGSYNHFFVPPPIENVLINSAGLTQLISEIGQPLPPLQPIVENQFELGLTQPIRGRLRAGATAYYRSSDKPVHTVLFPDVRVYGYANFDRGKAYGLELKMEMPARPDVGVSGYLNYAVGRVWFYNPVRAGFTTEAAHLNESNRFLAPMDQTHTFTSGVSYRHRLSGLWTAMTFEYGSGTPVGHGGAGHEHEAGEAAHAEGPAGAVGERVPSHFVQNFTIGWDTRLEARRFGIQFNIENVSNKLFVVAQESAFTPGQYSMPRQFSGSIRIGF